MLEITLDNCHKCDIETMNGPNDSQYFWINRRDLDIETKHNFFDKCKDSWRQKYRKESTPNITFQLNKIFVRNDLFEKIIKSCKASNLEFLRHKEKLVYVFMKTFVINKSLFQCQKKFLKKKTFLHSMMLKISNQKRKMRN